MRIELGWSLDGASWADAGVGGATGQVRMGPRGFVGLLQTRLGLTHPAVDQAVRITQYMLLVERTAASVGADFWPARSFALDPWSTARQLMRWRDAAIEAGWRPDSGHSTGHENSGRENSGWEDSGAKDSGPEDLPARILALAQVEERAVVGMPGTADLEGRPATLSPGAADDLAETVRELERLQADGVRWPLGIATLVLHEEPERLPGMWPRLISLLVAAGVRVEQLSASGASTTGASTAGPETVVVQCRDEWTAADVAARLLSAATQRTASDTHGDVSTSESGSTSGSTSESGTSDAATTDALHVLATTDTGVLDRALHRRGLPAIGAVERSSDRASHQVLGLFLDVTIAPVDVHQLAALLDLRVLPALSAEGDPVGLVPASVRRALLKALAREPGVGGAAWRDAFAHLEEKASVDQGAGTKPTPQDAAPPAPQDAAAPATHDTTAPAAVDMEAADASRAAAARRALDVAREIDRLIVGALPGDALRPGPIVERLDWLAERLRTIAHRDGDLLASLTQVRTVQQVLGMLDPSAPLSRRTLQQVIDACGPAGRSALARSEVAPWTTTTRPAQLGADGGTVLWWGPDADEASAPVVWDEQEASALIASGARLLPPENLASLQVEAGIRALRGARRVIAVLPGTRLEEAARPSSLLAQLETAAGLSEKDRLAPEDLIDGRVWSLAGWTLPVAAPAEEPPVPPLGTVRLVGRAAPSDGSTARPDGPAAPPVGPADLRHLLPTRLSYSQIDTLISCPHRWALQYALDVRPAEVASLPTGPRMIGTLVHAVVEELVREDWDEGLGGRRLDPPSAARIGATFDRLVPQLASELDLPGRSAQRAEIRGRAIRSLAELFGRTADAGWRITGTESRFALPLTLPLGGGSEPWPTEFVGSRDVDARAADGSPLVLDLKWTSSLRRYADLYDSGDAIQLASYAWSVAQEADERARADEPARADGRADAPARVGYFLLRDGEFVAADRALDPRRREELDVVDAWERMIATASGVLDRIVGGEVPLGCRTLMEEQGLDGASTYAQRTSALTRAREAARAEGRVFGEDHCGIGDYAQLCGLIGDRR